MWGSRCVSISTVRCRRTIRSLAALSATSIPTATAIRRASTSVPDGTLYSSEQGPKTDDEVNILKRGSNYGWPNVAGLKDNKAYEYARWAEASTPCAQLRFSDLAIHPSVPREPESAFKKPFDEANRDDVHRPDRLQLPRPGLQRDRLHLLADRRVLPALSITTSKGSRHSRLGQGSAGDDAQARLALCSASEVQRQSGGRSYVAATSSRKTAFAILPSAPTERRSTSPPIRADWRGVSPAAPPEECRIRARSSRSPIQARAPARPPNEPRAVSEAKQPSRVQTSTTAAAGGVPPQFTAAQAAAGKTAYNSNCAVCHGSTMTNGTFGTPLAGEYFKNQWLGKTVRAFLRPRAEDHAAGRSRFTAAETYADIVAYILEVNGFKAGDSPLPAGGDALNGMAIK